MITTSKEQYYCSNSTCKKAFDKPILIQYYACPHCKTKIQEEHKTSCQYWFGYLNEKQNSEQIPPECIECKKVVQCMLNHNYNSEAALTEIKKWY